MVLYLIKKLADILLLLLLLLLSLLLFVNAIAAVVFHRSTRWFVPKHLCESPNTPTVLRGWCVASLAQRALTGYCRDDLYPFWLILP